MTKEQLARWRRENILKKYRQTDPDDPSPEEMTDPYGPYIPTQQEIRVAAEEIRMQWDEKEYERRIAAAHRTQKVNLFKTATKVCTEDGSYLAR